MTIKLAHGFAKVEITHVGSYLHIITVEPDYRGKGVATKLMHKVLDRAPRPIFLLADGEFGSDVQRLMCFYSRFGFKREKQRKADGYPYNYNMVLY